MKFLSLFLFMLGASCISFAAGSHQCIVAVELNDLDFNDVNRRALKSALSDMNFQWKEFFIDNKEQLTRDSQSLSAVRLLNYGVRPGINEDAPYVGQSQISLIVSKSTNASVDNPSKMTYFIQVYSVKKVRWTVTTDDLGNKQAHFSGEVEKASEPIELGKRIVTSKDKLPPACDLFGKGKMDLINPEICSKAQVDEPVTDEATLIQQLAPYLNNNCH